MNSQLYRNERDIIRLATTIILVATCIAGCAGADVMLLDPSKSYPPTEHVQLLFDKPKRPYDVIAVIEAKGSQYNNESQTVRAAQNRAARIGAHAIILISNESEHVSPQVVPNPVLGSPPIYIMGGNRVTLKFAAIRFPENINKKISSSSQRQAMKEKPSSSRTKNVDEEVVTQIQIYLKNLKYNTGPIDGVFGKRTRRAIKAFQKDMGLPVNGKPSIELFNILKLKVEGR